MTLSVIIPWNDSSDRWRARSFDWVVERYRALLPDAEMNIGHSEPFNRGAARNSAVEQSTGDVLLIADADMVLQPAALQLGLQAIARGCAWVVLYQLGRYYNLTELESARIMAFAPDLEIREPQDAQRWDHKIDSWAGLLLVPREAFDKVGGYDEHFVGWGYEDNAFRAALDRKVGAHERVDGFALHLWHPAPDSDTFGHPDIATNRERARRYEAGDL